MTNPLDITARAQAALERVAERLPALPKPVLAAIGAADLAGRQLVDLVNQIGDRVGVKTPSLPDSDDVVDGLRSAASDLPGKVSELAADLPDKVQELVADLPEKAKDLADQIEQFAAAIPGKVQNLTEELPSKFAGLGEQLQPETLKHTAEAYGQLLGNVFDTLAERGEQTWDELRAQAPLAGTVVDAPTEAPVAKAAKPSAKAAAKPSTKAAAKPAAKKPTAKPSPAKAAAKASERTPRPARRKPTATATES